MTHEAVLIFFADILLAYISSLVEWSEAIYYTLKYDQKSSLCNIINFELECLINAGLEVGLSYSTTLGQAGTAEEAWRTCPRSNSHTSLVLYSLYSSNRNPYVLYDLYLYYLYY